MKHLLNNLSEEEKNKIREQHSGGIKIATDKFKTLLESKLGDLKPLVNEQSYDEKLVDEINRIGGSLNVISIFSDKNEKDRIGSFFVSEVFKNEDGSINIYPDEIKFSSPLGSKSGFKLLVFKCGTEGLLSKGNNKVVYSSKVENFLKSKMC
jgi:hypothetical protein